MPEAHTWFEGNRLCAVMPALILFDTVFEPMWRLGEVIEGIEGSYVCINAPKSGYAVVRSGRGFGRRGREKYYYIDFSKRVIVRVKHRPTKKLYGGWMTCIVLNDKKMCFEWKDDRLVATGFHVNV